MNESIQLEQSNDYLQMSCVSNRNSIRSTSLDEAQSGHDNAQEYLNMTTRTGNTSTPTRVEYDRLNGFAIRPVNEKALVPTEPKELFLFTIYLTFY